MLQSLNRAGDNKPSFGFTAHWSYSDNTDITDLGGYSSYCLVDGYLTHCLVDGHFLMKQPTQHLARSITDANQLNLS